MAVETITKRTASVALENGRDTEGNLKTVDMSLGAIATDRWDADKVLAIVTALGPCLSKDIYAAQGGTTFRITTQ